MALSDLSVFSEYLYTSMTEVVAQQIDLFNEASRGAIVLKSAAHQGDFSDTVIFAKIANLIRRRNAYGSGSVASTKLQMLIDTMVKVAAGIPPVELNPSQWKWIQMDPKTAGAALGQQMAGDLMADMLNTGILAAVAAISQVTALKKDVSAATPATPTPTYLAQAAGLFGDRAQDIAAWVMHSSAITNLYVNALQNAERLFFYGQVAVVADPFGRLYVVSDSPSLITSGSPTKYNTLGLVPGAVRIEQNNDFTDNYDTRNGNENITRTYQAEWSYELGIMGFQWDKTNGGKSPNDAALATSSNWDQYATSNKDTAGVILISQ